MKVMPRVAWKYPHIVAVAVFFEADGALRFFEGSVSYFPVCILHAG